MQETKMDGDYVYLNDAGKEEFKGIFDSDCLPVYCMLTDKATLGDSPEIHNIFRLDLKRLSDEEKKSVFDYVAKKRNGDRQQVEKELTEMGFVPMQSKWTSGSGTNQPYKYMPDFDFEGYDDEEEDYDEEEWGEDPYEEGEYYG